MSAPCGHMPKKACLPHGYVNALRQKFARKLRLNRVSSRKNPLGTLNPSVLTISLVLNVEFKMLAICSETFT